jgi:hypothetical protein
MGNAFVDKAVTCLRCIGKKTATSEHVRCAVQVNGRVTKVILVIKSNQYPALNAITHPL